MAVKIRLMRVGKRKQPHYRIVVVEEARKRDGAVSMSLATTIH
jgi:SSU ribosomal protein S16P